MGESSQCSIAVSFVSPSGETHPERVKMEMRWSISLRNIGLAFSVLLFSACANNQAKTTDTATVGPSDNSATSRAATSEPTPPATQPPVFIPNPSTIAFEKMSTTLDGKGKMGIAQLADRAKISNKVTVTGFCDRHQVGNSADAAVARAITVRDELLAHGVVPANVRVKFATNIRNRHAAEISFD